MVVPNGDAGGAAYALQDMPFQQSSARQEGRRDILKLSRAHELMPATTDTEFRQIAVVDGGNSGGHEFVEEPREKLIEDLGAPSQQKMEVPALWNAPAVSRGVGENIAFHYGDGVVEIGQGPRGQQPAHAGSQDN